MKRLSFILALVLVSFFFEIRTATALVYSPPDSCLKLVQEWRDTNGVIHGAGGLQNPDSVRVDSCRSSQTYGELYVTDEGYYTFFNYNIIPRNFIAPYDSIIEYSVSDIRPQFLTAKQEFQELENEYGTIIFREIHPNLPDTTTTEQRFLQVRFTGMWPIDAVYDKLKANACVHWCTPTKFLEYLTQVQENESTIEINVIVKNNFLKIINNSGNQLTNISLFDLQGSLISTFENCDTIDISNLRSGVYFAKINGKFYKFSIIK